MQRMRIIIVFVGVFGFSLLTGNIASAAENTQPNVSMYYSPGIGVRIDVYDAKVAHDWVPCRMCGGITTRYSKQGRTFHTLKVLPRQQLVSASYIYANTEGMIYGDNRWNGRGRVAEQGILKVHGKFLYLPLNEIRVWVYDPIFGTPPLKGRTCDVSCGK